MLTLVRGFATESGYGRGRGRGRERGLDGVNANRIVGKMNEVFHMRDADDDPETGSRSTSTGEKVPRGECRVAE